MKKFIKRIMAAFCAAATAVSFLSVVSAEGNGDSIQARVGGGTRYFGSPEYKITSGGSNGYITVRSRIFEETHSPAAGMITYSYGVVSDIVNQNNKSEVMRNLKTTFTITGKLYKKSSSEAINASGDGYSVTAQKISAAAPLYDYCASLTITNSDAFGYSKHECNRNIS